MLHRDGGKLNEKVSEELQNLRKLEYLVTEEFKTSNKKFVLNTASTSLNINSSGSYYSMLSLDSREKQLLIEKQQQQQRKETFKKITTSLREVNECYNQYQVDFEIAENHVVNNKKNIDLEKSNTKVTTNY